LAYSVYSFLNSYCDSGLLGIYMGIPPARMAEGIQVVREELIRIAKEPVSKEELDDAMMSLKGSILLSSESSETRMGRLARNEYNFGRSLSLDEVLDNLLSVTVDDVSRVARQILSLENLGGTVLGPVDEDCLAQGDLM
jgi:predicted Zn-dependent peptidase